MENRSIRQTTKRFYQSRTMAKQNNEFVIAITAGTLQARLTSVTTISVALFGTVWRPKSPHRPPAGSSLCHRLFSTARALTRTTTASGTHLLQKTVYGVTAKNRDEGYRHVFFLSLSSRYSDFLPGTRYRYVFTDQYSWHKGAR